MRHSVAAILAILIIPTTAHAQTAATAPASQPASQPAEAVSPLYLANVSAQSASNYSMDELAEMFPAFKHAPFETAGFNHLSLPFKYESMDITGSIAYADAFAFLLSRDLDWAPGCYCARHAYFVFKRSRRYMTQLARYYNPKLIAYAIDDWEATHAIGGTIYHSSDGFAGKLQIFDKSGKVAFEKKYPEFREFFQLLGDMSVDSMRFFGYQPSDALIEHLSQARCDGPQSILDLGKAAWLKERSTAEFSLYKKILKRDPGFSDVRYWYANQKYWKDRKRRSYSRAKAKVMDGYPVAVGITGLSRLMGTPWGSKKLAWIETRVADLVGRDHPSLLDNRLREATFRATYKVPDELLDRVTPIVAKYPNNHMLTQRLGHAYMQNHRRDFSMAASCHIASLRGKSLRSNDKSFTIEKLADCMEFLGRDDIAVQFYMPLLAKYQSGGKKKNARKTAHMASKTARCLMNMMQYDQAVKYYRIAFHGIPRIDTRRRASILGGAAVAAALASRKDIVDQILRDRKPLLVKSKYLALVEAYRDCLEGKKVLAQQVEDASGPSSWHGSKDLLHFYAQMDLNNGSFDHFDMLKRSLLLAPLDRQTSALFDAFDRAKPEPQAAAYYDMLEWLLPDDPWVRKVVSDRRERMPEGQYITADELLAKLADFEPIRWPEPNEALHEKAKENLAALEPGTIEAAIKRLLDAGDFDKSTELALRYKHLVIASEGVATPLTHHMVYLVEQARQKASAGGAVLHAGALTNFNTETTEKEVVHRSSFAKASEDKLH